MSAEVVGKIEVDDPGRATSSKSGGGSRSCLDALAAKAIASRPYGMPNLAKDSLDDISFNCSGVGPDLGYVNSVRVRVCVRGAEMELREIMEGEVRLFECRVFVDFLRDKRKLEMTEPEPESVGRCVDMRDRDGPMPWSSVLMDCRESPRT